MKRILVLLMLPSLLYAPRLTVEFQNRHRNTMPKPIKAPVDLLKNYVHHPYLRMGIAGIVTVLAATDNPAREKFLKLVRLVQSHCTKANQVANEAHSLEQNYNAWRKMFNALA